MKDANVEEKVIFPDIWISLFGNLTLQIRKPVENLVKNTRIREELELLIAQPGPAELAPCQNCGCHIPDKCSSKCVEAPGALSSDPINHPLEKKVVPLVFELTSTRLMTPCWSCEGHFNQDGELWKLPQINFYSDSAVYPQLLLRHINRLKMDKKIAYDWRVVLSDFGQDWYLSYSVEPNLNRIDNPRLGLLQQDLIRISEGLSDNLKLLAKHMLAELN